MPSFARAECSSDFEDEVNQESFGDIIGGLPIFEELGVPNQTTLAVADLDAVRDQITAAVGIEWREETEETHYVFIRGEGKKKIQFRRVFSKPGEPFIELIQATPAIGPWQATADSSSGYIAYRVDNVLLQGLQLGIAGFKLVALAHNCFAVYEATAGVRVALVRSDLAPAVSEPFTPQAPITLPTIQNLGWSINPSNREELKQQFQDGLSLNWAEDLYYPQIPFYYSELSGAATAGFYPTDITISGALESGPVVEFESGGYDLSPCDCNPCQDPCKLAPFNTTDTTSVFQPFVWYVDPEVINPLKEQWENAGLEFVMELDVGTGIPLLSHYLGTGGILFEFVNTAQPTE